MSNNTIGLMEQRYRFVVFTGAGISQESGIPTFADMPGIREKLTREFAIKHPLEYNEVIQYFMNTLKDKRPNAAHYAIASVDAPVLTMNIDTLHQQAGSRNVITLHGELPDKVVLYGDPAPMYSIGFKIVKNMKYKDSILLVVGTSFYTEISREIVRVARRRCAKVIIVNENAATKVPKIIEGLKRAGVI